MNIEQEQVIDSESLRFKSVEIVRENAEPDTLSPLCRLQFNLPLSSGQWPIVLEGFDDGSWAAYFKGFSSLIAGSNDSWKESLHDLVMNAIDELHSFREYGDNISVYQKKRRQFLEEVFDYGFEGTSAKGPQKTQRG